MYQCMISKYIYTSGQKFYFYFGGLLFTSHWLNLQHWTGFYKLQSMAIFRGSFFFFRAFFCISGAKLPGAPCYYFPGIIQIYQALRKDSGNYTSEEDWHISIFPRGEAPRKNRKIASPPKMCNFHYPFEIKAWYICFISLLYKFKTYTKIWRNRFGFATRGNNVSQCTDWMTCPSVRRSACSCSSYTT